MLSNSRPSSVVRQPKTQSQRLKFKNVSRNISPGKSTVIHYECERKRRCSFPTLNLQICTQQFTKPPSPRQSPPKPRPTCLYTHLTSRTQGNSTRANPQQQQSETKHAGLAQRRQSALRGCKIYPANPNISQAGA